MHGDALIDHLILRAEDVRVVLGEGAHAHDAVQRAGGLVAVHLAELGDAQGQVAVALEPILEDLNVAGAVHRLAAEHALVRGLGHEHVLAELLPMAGLLPELALHHVGRVHLDIAVILLAAAHIVDERAEQRPAVGVPEHRARRLFLEVEQVHLAAKAAMVALLGLFKLVNIGVELLFCGPGGAVDALELLALGVAAPVGAGQPHQLERRADLAGRGQMRPAAKVEPLALAVDLYIVAFRDRVDKLDLEALALVREELARLARGQTSLVKGLSAATMARIFSSILARSSGVKLSSR